MRTPTGTFFTACALSAALIVAGCAGDQHTRSSGELFLQPAAAEGPDPFTDSTATSTATPAPATRTRQPSRSGLRSISGSTPGLYGGTVRTGSCDVNRQIAHLGADRARGQAFAQVEGVSQDSIPVYLRSLTPVVLRADTRVTNHGYRDGHATGYQSVLQAGTAVLVDNRGVPRVRCACGNPLTPARAMGGGSGTSGRPWPGYRHGEVVVVRPTIEVITHITIIDIVNNTWIERRCGHDTRHDHVVPPPDPVPPTPTPTGTETVSPSRSESGAPTGPSSPSPSTGDTAAPNASPGDSPSTSATGESSTPERLTPDCVTPTVTVTPGVPLTGTTAAQDPACPAVTVTAPPPTTAPETVPDLPTVEEPSQEIGPETVPDTPDLPDGGGLIPDAPDEPTTTDSIFGSPTDVWES